MFPSTGVFSSFPGFSTPSASSLLTSYKTEISYDTSSRDPAALRSRVFVGNLNTNRVTREDVIQMFQAYGTLAGVTLFKGYAFVQYSHATEADLAVSALNGYNWNGSVLDVKLAAHGMKSSSSNFGQTTKRASDLSGMPKPKKTAIGYGNSENNNENKAFAKGVTVPVSVERADTLICGGCRFITSNVNKFIQHRKEPCHIFKIEGEPKKLQCFTCSDTFGTSWQLVKHLTSTHKMILYKELSTVLEAEDDENDTAGNLQQIEPDDANNNGSDNEEFKLMEENNENGNVIESLANEFIDEKLDGVTK